MAAFERATVGLVLWWSASNGFASNPAGVLTATRAGVAETAERFETDARARGLTVVERTDHSGAARRDGYRIRPIQTLSVCPGDGSTPTRLVIWQAPSGDTMVSIDERPAHAAPADADAVLLPTLRAAIAAGESAHLN